jgi:hypothetical protein
MKAVTARRAHVTATVRVRLHQRLFRERVLAAYQGQWASCRLRVEALLDAAHTVPDTPEHAIHGLHGSRIVVPQRLHLRAAPELVEIRYERFRQWRQP